MRCCGDCFYRDDDVCVLLDDAVLNLNNSCFMFKEKESEGLCS